SQSDAEAALAEVKAGTPFAQVASKVSGGGPQGCQILYGIAGQLGTSLLTLKNGAVSTPLPYSNGVYLLLQITSRTPTPFAKAESAVHEAAVQAGAADARDVLQVAEQHSVISVNPRYGSWVR